MKYLYFASTLALCVLTVAPVCAAPKLSTAQITKLNNDKALAHATVQSLVYPNGVPRTTAIGKEDAQTVATLLAQENAILFDIDNDDNGQPINKSEIPLAIEGAQNQIVLQLQIISDILTSPKYAELAKNLPALEAALGNSYSTLDNELYNNAPALTQTFFAQEESMDGTAITFLLELP